MEVTNAETTPSDIKTWKVNRLKVELGKLGLSKSGNRNELVNRLADYRNKEVRSDRNNNEPNIINPVSCNGNPVSIEEFIIVKEELKSLTEFVRQLYFDKIKFIEDDRISKMEKEIDFLRSESSSKSKVIEILSEELNLSEINKTDFKDQSGEWLKVHHKNKFLSNKLPVNTTSVPSLEIKNRFNSLAANNEDDYNDTENNNEDRDAEPTPLMAKYNEHIVVESNKRPSVVINHFPEKNHINLNKIPTIPGNSNYAEILKHGKKVLITGDSIIRRIQYKEFNRVFQGGKAIIKPFPGATANEIDHYILPHLKTILPDIVIVNAGSNNISRGRVLKQSNEEIVEELLKIGLTCRENGVNRVIISGLCYRNSTSLNRKINDINIILRNRCSEIKFEFIDNQNIQVDCHLWKDGLHLNDEGIEILANNYLKHLNVNYNIYD